MNTKKLILASASPRRREILESCGYAFDIISPDAEEVSGGLAPALLTMENSKRKAMAALNEICGVIICADTVVALDDKVLGKPKTAENAKKMLSSLSGRSHSVVTGYTITDGDKAVSGYVETTVTMRRLFEDEIDEYIKVCSPLDKAGAYGIQEAAGMFVEKIDGDYYNVVGLPISKISEILRTEFDICAFMK